MPCQPVIAIIIALKQQGLPNYAFSLLLAAPELLSRPPLQVGKDHQTKREELRPLRSTESAWKVDLLSRELTNINLLHCILYSHTRGRHGLHKGVQVAHHNSEN